MPITPICEMSRFRNVLAVVDNHNRISLFDKNGALHLNKIALSDRIKKVVFSSDSQYICAFGDKEFCIYDVSSFEKQFYSKLGYKILDFNFCHNDTELYLLVSARGAMTRQLLVCPFTKQLQPFVNDIKYTIIPSDGCLLEINMFAAIVTCGSEGIPLVLSGEYACWFRDGNLITLNIGRPIRKFLRSDQSSCVVIETDDSSLSGLEFYQWMPDVFMLQKVGHIKDKNAVDDMAFLPRRNSIIYTTLGRSIFMMNLTNGSIDMVPLSESQQNHAFFSMLCVSNDEDYMAYFYRNRTIDRSLGVFEMRIPDLYNTD